VRSGIQNGLNRFVLESSFQYAGEAGASHRADTDGPKPD